MTEVGRNNFPIFDCKITGKGEEYDSDIAMFFNSIDKLSARIGELSFLDSEWKGNYVPIIRYLKDLDKAVIENMPPPDHQFLIELCLGEEVEGDSYDLLINAKSSLTPRIQEAAFMVYDLMYWFVRLSRKTGLEQNFTPERFSGLPFLRLALSYRSMQV